MIVMLLGTWLVLPLWAQQSLLRQTVRIGSLTFTFPSSSGTASGQVWQVDGAAGTNAAPVVLSPTTWPVGTAPTGDDYVRVADSTTAATWRLLPNCVDTSGNHLNYTLATNLWNCGTSGGASAPTSSVCTDFSAAARFTETLLGTGSSTVFNLQGLRGTTGATAGAGTRHTFYTHSTTVASGNLLSAGTVFSAVFRFVQKGTDGNFYVGASQGSVLSATGLTLTNSHFGFKLTWTASGAATLAATQSGGTESATNMDTNILEGDIITAIAKMVSTTAGDYYYQKNAGAMSAATTISTNFPTTSVGTTEFGVNNNNVASSTIAEWLGSCVER